MLDTIRELSDIEGISGFEDMVAAYIHERLKDAPAVESITVDRIGNCIVYLKGKQPAPHRVVMAAHMDEVGFMITHITKDGYLTNFPAHLLLMLFHPKRCVLINE